jgi:hypothetical protein
MKPKPDIDPDFATARWGSMPRTVARWLLIFVLATGALAIIPAEPTKAPQAFAQGAIPAPGSLRLTIQQPAPELPITITEPQPRDGFVVMASRSIDPQMVHAAPAGIDESMVVRLPSRRATSPILVMPSPKKPREMPVPRRPNSETPDAKLGPKGVPK